MLKEALLVYPIYQSIAEHFKEHYILTQEDFERLQSEEYQCEVRRSYFETNGEADLVMFNHVDLP